MNILHSQIQPPVPYVVSGRVTISLRKHTLVQLAPLNGDRLLILNMRFAADAVAVFELVRQQGRGNSKPQKEMPVCVRFDFAVNPKAIGTLVSLASDPASAEQCWKPQPLIWSRGPIGLRCIAPKEITAWFNIGFDVEKPK